MLKLSVLPLATMACLLTACARPQPLSRPSEPVVLRAATVPAKLVSPQSFAPNRRHEPDRQAQAERDASEVFHAMHGDLLRCLSRGARGPAHAYVTADVLVGPDGRVREVATTGGALVGPMAMKCFERRIARATFTPPHAGGASRLTVPFTFEREPP